MMRLVCGVMLLSLAVLAQQPPAPQPPSPHEAEQGANSEGGTSYNMFKCNALIVSDSCPVWYRYTELFLNSAEAGLQLFNCIDSSNLAACTTPVQRSVREVFKSVYSIANCPECCWRRRAMVRDLMQHWENKNMTSEQQMIQHFREKQ